MKRVTFSVLFFIKKSRINKQGKASLMLRITVNGFVKEAAINLKINAEHWDQKSEKILSNKQEDYEANLRIDSIRLKVMQIYREFEFDKREITAESVMNRFLGIDEQSKNLIEVFQEHNEKCYAMIGKGMSAQTVTRYETTLKHVADFIERNCKMKDYPLDKVNHEFITNLEFYLKTVRNCNHNTATKYLKNFKKIIRIALANEWIKRDPFANIKFKLQEVERPFLTKEEIEVLSKKQFNTDRLEHIKDIFLYCYFTGLAFSDIKNLKTEHLVKDNQGKLTIIIRQQKRIAVYIILLILKIPSNSMFPTNRRQPSQF
ncbi:MAG: site-specific integrase [Odoribacter sp.]|nr:site-specific integrase [Odoribacter sp.]